MQLFSRVVGQLGGVDEGVVVAFVALNDLPAHLVLRLLQKEREAWRWADGLADGPCISPPESLRRQRSSLSLL